MSYKMDKTFAKAQTFAEADDNKSYWNKKTYEERLNAAYFLICSAYNLSHSNLHSLDKKVCVCRKHHC